LAAVGVTVPEREVPVPIVYVSRFYRLRDGETFLRTQNPGSSESPAAASVLCLLHLAGRRRNVLRTTAVPVSDRDLRMKLRDPDTFDRACLTVPEIRPWVERPSPSATVAIMAGLTNRIRHFTDGDGQPLVLGLHAVGDTHMCTNPAYGRGLFPRPRPSRIARRRHGGTRNERPEARHCLRGAFHREAEPWFDFAVQSDAMFFFDGAPENRTRSCGHADRDAGTHSSRPSDRQHGPAGLVRTYNLLVGPEPSSAIPKS